MGDFTRLAEYDLWRRATPRSPQQTKIRIRHPDHRSEWDLPGRDSSSARNAILVGKRASFERGYMGHYAANNLNRG